MARKSSDDRNNRANQLNPNNPRHSDNRSNQLNPNNDAYWQERGHSKRPANWRELLRRE